MITTETLFVAAPLERLISGNITSKDITEAKKLVDKTEGLVANLLKVKSKAHKLKKYDFDKIAFDLGEQEATEDLIEKGSKLLKNTDIEFTDLIPKIEEIKLLLKGLLPTNQVEDVMGVHLKEPSTRDKLGFLRLYGAIDNPLSVIGRVVDNSFTKAEMDIVREAYPELMQGIESMITNALMEMKAQGKEVVGNNLSLGIKRMFGESV